MITNGDKIRTFGSKAFNEFVDFILPYLRKHEGNTSNWYNEAYDTERWLDAVNFVYAPEYRKQALILFEIGEFERTITPYKEYFTNGCLAGIWTLVTLVAGMLIVNVLAYRWWYYNALNL